MTRLPLIHLSAASMALLAATGLQAAATRSEAALPAAARAQASAPPAQPQGPKNGFPDSPGLERAREVANEHARFLRSDSHG